MTLNASAYRGSRVSPLGGSGRMLAFAFMPGVAVLAGTVVAQASASVNEVQTLNATGTVSGGTFELSIGTATPVEVAYDVSNADLKTAIEALLVDAGFVGGTVTITNGPLPADTTVTFGGGLAGRPVPLLVVDDGSITGGGTLEVVRTTPGATAGSWGAYDATRSDGLEVAKGVADFAFNVNDFGGTVAGEAPDEESEAADVPIWVSGRFQTEELVGLDADAVTALGRLEQGSTSAGVLIITG